MRLCAGFLAWTPALLAHVVSMSSSDLVIHGSGATFELRMPLYEIAHVGSPEKALLDHVRFAGGRLSAGACASDAESGQYVCRAEYQFDAPVERLDVECTLAAITVPNHVHLLRARLGERRDQGVFDISFTRATLRFRPPTAAEKAVTAAGGGAVRALGGAMQLLLLAALALAGRGRRELLTLAAMFVAGQVLSVALLPRLAWQPAPRFVEAAAAVTLAYLAVEILFLPQAGGRWMVAGVLGVFHGMYFHLFLQATGSPPVWVLVGAAAAQCAAGAVFALLFAAIRRVARLKADG